MQYYGVHFVCYYFDVISSQHISCDSCVFQDVCMMCCCAQRVLVNIDMCNRAIDYNSVSSRTYKRVFFSAILLSSY